MEQELQFQSKVDKLVVAAIDFGTTFSGYAFSFKHDYIHNPLKIYANTSWSANTSAGLVSWKTPTTLLLYPDMNFMGFGYEAEEEYNELIEEGEHRPYHYFRRFKMMLYNKKVVNRDVTIEDAGGTQFPATLVFKHSIRYLKDHLIGTLRDQNLQIDTEREIQWVLTLPAIWNEPAKQFMREAAALAGIPSDSLILALEPEAASLLCKYLPIERSEGEDCTNIVPFKIGTRYMILDLGGGTVDVTVHEVAAENALHEIHKASGGAWGGTTVDKAYMRVIYELFGEETIEAFKHDQRTGMLEFQRDFEMKKRNIRDVVAGGRQKPIVVTIPARLNEIHKNITGKELKQTVLESKYKDTITCKPGNKLGFDRQLLETMFETAKSGIISHVQSILNKESVGEKISAILMVGGFSTSKIIVEAVREAFPDLRVAVPPEPGLAIVKGAVLYGHAPLSIASRVCKYTYGVAILDSFNPEVHPDDKRRIQNGEVLCRDVFDKFIEIGDSVSAEEVIKREYGVTELNKPMEIQIFASEISNPILTTDEDCYQLGKILIHPPAGGWKRGASITVKMEFGGTEFKVTAVDSQNMECKYETSFDFLANVTIV